MAGRRTVGVRGAEGPVVRDRRRAPVRIPRAIQAGIPSVSCAAGARWQLRPGAGAERRPDEHLVPIADALRLLQQLHRGAELPSGRRHDWPRCSRKRARTSASSCGRPASRRWPTCFTSPNWRASTKLAAASRSAASSTSCRRAAQSTEAAEAPILEEGSDGVRLMTVHKAKGLEFPVVILADLTCRMNRNDASRYLDPARGLCAIRLGGWAPHELHDHEAEEVARDEAEGVRLAYVAATRARDLLVVPARRRRAVGRRLAESAQRRRCIRRRTRVDASATRGPKCPVFKSKDTVLAAAERRSRGTRRPSVRASTTSQTATRSSGGIRAR